MRTKPIDRFNSRFIPEPNTGCWLWTDSVDKDGYGDFWHLGKNFRAHRFSYAIHKGEIPFRMMVCHSCDQPGCVNPDHLFLGTSKDNAQDRNRKGRNANVKGEKNPMSKLSADNVTEIKTLLSNGMYQEDIAKMFSTSQANISFISSGKRWI